MKFEGSGYEYSATYLGGPADGLTSGVVTSENDMPPDISAIELHNLIESKSPLGQHFLKQHSSKLTRVGVYLLEKEPEDYSADEVLVYRFIEMMNYGEFVEKYED